MLLLNYCLRRVTFLELDRLPVLFHTHLCTRTVRSKDKWLCAVDIICIHVFDRNDLTYTREK
jgi:hypothetical protein